MMYLLTLLACSTLAGAAGLWLGYLWGFAACLEWFSRLTGVRLPE